MKTTHYSNSDRGERLRKIREQIPSQKGKNKPINQIDFYRKYLQSETESIGDDNARKRMRLFESGKAEPTFDQYAKYAQLDHCTIEELITGKPISIGARVVSYSDALQVISQLSDLGSISIAEDGKSLIINDPAISFLAREYSKISTDENAAMLWLAIKEQDYKDFILSADFKHSDGHDTLTLLQKKLETEMDYYNKVKPLGTHLSEEDIVKSALLWVKRINSDDN